MRVRFQADADLSQHLLLAVLRRAPNIDFQTASQAGLLGAPDSEVLARAAQEGRVLVTHDRRTMPAHFAEFVVRESCPGLLVVPQSLAIATAVAELILIWETTTADEWIDRIVVLPL